MGWVRAGTVAETAADELGRPFERDSFGGLWVAVGIAIACGLDDAAGVDAEDGAVGCQELAKRFGCQRVRDGSPLV